MPMQDVAGQMTNDTADKIKRMEEMPLLMQQQYDEGLVSYMVRNSFIWQKIAFIRKTYCFLIGLLVVSYLVSIPFMHNPMGTVDWLSRNNWMLWLSAVIIILQLAFYMAVLGFLAVGQPLAMLAFLKIMNSPVGYVWSALYAICFSVIVGSILASYNVTEICHTYLFTAIAVMGILLYTYVVKNADFKMLYAYLVPVATSLFIFLVSRAGDSNPFLLFIACSLSILFGWIVVFDTQLIFGAKQERGRKYPYQMKMWAFAAYEMYFDLFVNFYLQSLKMFPVGDMDSPLDVKA